MTREDYSKSASRSTPLTLEKIATENPAHDKWFAEFYEEGYLLREHIAYLYSLWAWQARSCLPANAHQIKRLKEHSA
jgi:hypothetical protein